MGWGVCRVGAQVACSGMIQAMTTPAPTERMFTASSAAKECKVGRSTVHRYLEQGRLSGAEQDEDGVWQIPLSALLSVGWTPGRSAPTVDGDRERDRDKARDSDRHVSLEVHHLTVELEQARAEARVQSAKVDALERVLAHYERQLEQGESSHTPPEPTQANEQAAPKQAHAPSDTGPSTGKWRRAWNVVRYG